MRSSIPLLHNNKINSIINCADFDWSNQYLNYYQGDNRYIQNNQNNQIFSGSLVCNGSVINSFIFHCFQIPQAILKQDLVI
jgi:hypothetical protein